MFRWMVAAGGLALCPCAGLAQEMPPCEAPLYLGGAEEGAEA